MNQEIYYEVIGEGEEFLGIRAVDKKDHQVVGQMEDLSDNRDYITNLVRLYNENNLLLAHFEDVTERLIGILI